MKFMTALIRLLMILALASIIFPLATIGMLAKLMVGSIQGGWEAADKLVDWSVAKEGA